MPSPYGWNNNYSQGITAAGGSHLIPRDFGDSRQGMGGMANRRGSSMGGGGTGRVPYGGEGKFLDVRKLLAERINAAKKNLVPNIGQAYNKAANLQIGAATQEANQAQQSHLANYGNTGGIGSQLFASGMKQEQLLPALAQEAQTRALGAEAQFNAERQARDEYDNLLLQMNQLWQQELARRERARQMGQGGGSPTSGGGGGGFRVIDSPSPWDRQREVDRMAPQMWGDRYWENPEYKAAYEAAGMEG